MVLRFTLAAATVLTLAGCAISVKDTPGMKMMAAGQASEAIPVLEQEARDGQSAATYALGVAYRDGKGVSADPRRAEILLTEAAVAGDPRAVTAVRQMLQADVRCDKDRVLDRHWGGLAVAVRNLVTGQVELQTAPPAMLVQMADIYDRPCEGRPTQHETAQRLRYFASLPRTIYIAVPG